MLIEFSTTLILLGSIQAFLLSITLFMWKKNREANSILAAVLFLLSVRMYLFFASERYDPFDEFTRDLIRSIPFLFPALFYFYAIKVLKGEHVANKAIHAIPIVLYILVVVGYFKTNLVFFRYFKEALGIFGRELYEFLLILGYSISYFYTSLQKEKKFPAKQSDVKWLAGIFYSYLLITLFELTLAILIRFPVWALDYNPFIIENVLVTLFMYWITYKAMVQPSLFHRHETKHQLFDPEYEKYHNVQLTPEQSLSIINKLKESMTQSRLYLNKDLKLDELSSLLAINRNHLSQIINTKLDSSFLKYVNTYRVEEAKAKLVNRKFDYLTIRAIAADSGFNSVATFNRVFKEFTGLTPKAFKSKMTSHPTG